MAASKPAPAPPPKPAPKGAAERMKELAEREKASPRAFRTLYRAWAEFRKDAPPEALETARDQMERLHSAATKEYRVLWHPVHEKLRDLLGAHEPRGARKLLEAWTVPEELDVTGDHAEDVRKQIVQVGELIAFEDQRTRLFADYRRGEFSTDVVQALAPWTGAPQVHVRAEADNAVAELKLIRALGLLKQRLASRRAAALSRVDEARRQIALDAAAEKDRTAAWEARLKEQTARRPIPVSQLGVKDMNDQLRVTKYNGRIVSLASNRMELTYTMDELPLDVFSRLVIELPDPQKPSELIEAGKAAVRRGAFEPARRLFTQAVRIDGTTADLIPDLARLSGGIGTLRGRAELQGETIAIRYDFQSAEQARDFRFSPNTKALPVGGALALEGEGLFWAMPGDLKFSGRIRVSADPAGIGGAGYAVGVAAEITPGDPDLFVALVQPDRGYRLSRIRTKGQPETVGEGGLNGRSGMIEFSVDAGKAELRVGGVTLWTGSLPEFTMLQPVAGAWAFQEGKVQVSYRSLRLEGRASPEGIRRLQSERLTVMEAELSRERRTTSEERTAASGFRSFGDGMTTPLSLETELAELIPLKVKMSYAAGRTYLRQLERAKSDQLISRLWGQVRQTIEEAIREAPWFPLTYYYRAEWRLAEGDVAGAMRDLGEASANQEGFVEARVARGELLVRDGKYKEAAKEIDEALVLAPDLARARLTRALLNYYAGRDADAVLELELARRLEPGDMFVRRSAKRLRNIIAGPRWSGTVAVETPDYAIRTESPRLPKKGKKEDLEKQERERTQRYADHLGAARGYFTQVVSGAESRARKPVVYVCDTPESYYVYADFTSEDRLEHTAGVFFNQYQQLLFFRAETEEETLQTMTHEAFHEYLHAILPSVPTWLDEGLAEYVSGVEIAGGRVTSVGGILKGRLRSLQAALEAGWEGFEFPFVLGESKEQFYSLFPELQYAQAWSMVHFLMHGKGGKYKPLLDRYLQVLKQTRSAAEARAVFTGADLPALQREWASYVKSLR
jgi:tetratricopeptide (TPR) repeat protein